MAIKSRIMSCYGECSTHGYEKMHTEFLSGNMKGRDHLEVSERPDDQIQY